MDKLEAYLKLAILILLVIFLVLFTVLPKTDCDKTNYEINGKRLTAEEFIDIYFKKCFDFTSKLRYGNLDNLTIVKG